LLLELLDYVNNVTEGETIRLIDKVKNAVKSENVKIEFSVFYSKDYGSTRAYESNKITDDPEMSNKGKTTKSFMLFYFYSVFP